MVSPVLYGEYLCTCIPSIWLSRDQAGRDVSEPHAPEVHAVGVQTVEKQVLQVQAAELQALLVQAVEIQALLVQVAAKQAPEV